MALNPIAEHLDRVSFASYLALSKLSDADLAQALSRAAPSIGGALVLDLLGRIAEYRRVILGMRSEPPSNATETSDAAATKLKPHLTPARLKVLAAVAALGRPTCEDVEIRIKGSHQSTSARLNDCLHLGWAYRPGEKRRNRRSGSLAYVWDVTDEGWRVLLDAGVVTATTG